MDQSARTAALEAFRNGEVTLLVASDVAARGLDIPAVSHVFNFDVPHHADDYVHRIGRTGRAGLSGTAITIVAPDRPQVGRRDRAADRPDHPLDGRRPQPALRPTSRPPKASVRSAADAIAAKAGRRRTATAATKVAITAARPAATSTNRSAPARPRPGQAHGTSEPRRPTAATCPPSCYGRYRSKPDPAVAAASFTPHRRNLYFPIHRPRIASGRGRGAACRRASALISAERQTWG